MVFKTLLRMSFQILNIFIKGRLVSVFGNCFMFLKRRKIEKTCLISSFFFLLQNIKNNKFK